MLNLQLTYLQAVNQIESIFQFESLIKQVRSPFALAKQLGLSGWIRISIYLVLDYIILPANVIHKILPDTQFTKIFSSLSLAIYIVPELKEVARRIQN